MFTMYHVQCFQQGYSVCLLNYSISITVVFGSSSSSCVIVCVVVLLCKPIRFTKGKVHSMNISSSFFLSALSLIPT